MSHQDFLNAFQLYMASGDTSSLSPFLEGERPNDFLSIYRNGFFKAAIEALGSNFISVKTALNHDHFLYLARTYVEKYPPHNASLVGYGMDESSSQHSSSMHSNATNSNASHSDQPSFLAYLQEEPSLAEHAYVLDLGLLDQTWLQALNSKEDVPISITDVQSMINEGKDLTLLPISMVASSQIVSLSYDVFDVWSHIRFANLDDSAFAQTEYGSAEDVCLLFWRQENQVQARQLSKAELVFLETLSEESSLVSAEERASIIDNEFDLSLFFADLLNGQILKLVP